ncbi:hypothetical protein [Micromonospora sp. NPDC050276]|uniref:hypothetical protein n=1 Tax=Micromonospora sp. NPDC050276 TaxID=3364278 RepID=UPI0037B4C633
MGAGAGAYLLASRPGALEPHLGRYELVFQQICGIVAELEDRQVREGKGMTVESNDPEAVAASLAHIAGKLGFPVDRLGRTLGRDRTAAATPAATAAPVPRP